MENRQMRRGFTLIELLVSIGIIAVLIAITVPAIQMVRSRGRQAAILETIHGVMAGLEQYHNDFNMYPPSNDGQNPTVVKGGVLLAQAMLGCQDYAGDGAGPGNPIDASESQYGFRVNKGGRGKVYGPYVAPKLLNTDATSAANGYLMDNSVKGSGALLYYRADTSGNLNNKLFGSGSGSVFQMGDNDPAKVGDQYCTPDANINDYNDPKKNALMAFRKKMGIIGDTSNKGIPPNNIIPGSVIPMAASYLLLSPGQDGVYFTADDVVNEVK